MNVLKRRIAVYQTGRGLKKIWGEYIEARERGDAVAAANTRLALVDALDVADSELPAALDSLAADPREDLVAALLSVADGLPVGAPAVAKALAAAELCLRRDAFRARAARQPPPTLLQPLLSLLWREGPGSNGSGSSSCSRANSVAPMVAAHEKAAVLRLLRLAVQDDEACLEVARQQGYRAVMRLAGGTNTALYDAAAANEELTAEVLTTVRHCLMCYHERHPPPRRKRVRAAASGLRPPHTVDLAAAAASARGGAALVTTDADGAAAPPDSDGTAAAVGSAAPVGATMPPPTPLRRDLSSSSLADAASYVYSSLYALVSGCETPGGGSRPTSGSWGGRSGGNGGSGSSGSGKSRRSVVVVPPEVLREEGARLAELEGLLGGDGDHSAGGCGDRSNGGAYGCSGGSRNDVNGDLPSPLPTLTAAASGNGEARISALQDAMADQGVLRWLAELLAEAGAVSGLGGYAGAGVRGSSSLELLKAVQLITWGNLGTQADFRALGGYSGLAVPLLILAKAAADGSAGVLPRTAGAAATAAAGGAVASTSAAAAPAGSSGTDSPASGSAAATPTPGTGARRSGGGGDGGASSATAGTVSPLDEGVGAVLAMVLDGPPSGGARVNNLAALKLLVGLASSSRSLPAAVAAARALHSMLLVHPPNVVAFELCGGFDALMTVLSAAAAAGDGSSDSSGDGKGGRGDGDRNASASGDDRAGWTVTQHLRMLGAADDVLRLAALIASHRDVRALRSYAALLLRLSSARFQFNATTDDARQREPSAAGLAAATGSAAAGPGSSSSFPAASAAAMAPRWCLRCEESAVSRRCLHPECCGAATHLLCRDCDWEVHRPDAAAGHSHIRVRVSPAVSFGG
ncbi:unnamed protein product, partial [Phaeothamnion confervicola]